MPPTSIRAYALRLLARREHSRQELIAKLLKKGVPATAALELVAELTAQGWQSDQRFLEGYTRTRIAAGFGPLKIIAELTQRGIDREIVEEFWRQNPPAWATLIQTIRQKHFGIPLPTSLDERAKQARYLSSRGFTHNHIRGAFNHEE